MILSKGNLQVVAVAQDDKAIAGLDNILIEKGGCTVAVNRNTIIIVGAVDENVRKAVPLDETKLDIGLVVSGETIKEVIKNVPRDTMFKGLLEHCEVNKDADFTITDGKRKKRIGGKKYAKKFIDYRKLIRHGNIVNSVVVNYKRLHNILDVLGKSSPDVIGESVVFLEFTDDHKMILRTRNMKNNQEVFVITTCYEKSSRDAQKFLLPLRSAKIKRTAKVRIDGEK